LAKIAAEIWIRFPALAVATCNLSGSTMVHETGRLRKHSASQAQTSSPGAPAPVPSPLFTRPFSKGFCFTLRYARAEQHPAFNGIFMSCPSVSPAARKPWYMCTHPPSTAPWERGTCSGFCKCPVSPVPLGSLMTERSNLAVRGCAPFRGQSASSNSQQDCGVSVGEAQLWLGEVSHGWDIPLFVLLENRGRLYHGSEPAEEATGLHQ